MRTACLAILAVTLLGCAPKGQTDYDDPLATPEMKRFAPQAVELGWQYFNKGDLDTAMRRFRMAVRHDATYAPGYYGVAYVHSVRGELDDAIKFYRLTLEHDQSYPYTFANLGYALLQKESFEEGLRMLDKALEMKPDCGEAYLSYANYYAFKQNWKKAEESVNKAIGFGQKIHPEFRALLESHGVRINKDEAPSKTAQGMTRPAR
jgi:Tfp pilus assembly protein PilF